MRLKTLRKERPAFENEGAVINGSRMDLSNSEFKPAKQRSNNTFALPTSLNNELSYLNLTPSDQTPEIYPRHSQQTSTHRNFRIPGPSQATHTSSYQAIEAAYREHGIRIQLSSTTAAAVSQQNIQSTENLTGRKSANSLQRNKAFTNRNPSRASSALHYSTTKTDLNQDSRPFSALQQTSTTDFEQSNMHNVSYIQPIESQVTLKSSEQLNTHFCSSSIVANEHSNPVTPPPHLAITNGTVSTATLIDNDPDLAYMSTLLQTTSGDSFRDTIRRRAGLRATFAVHRHPQPITTATTTTTMTTINSKPERKPPIIQPSTINRRNSLVHNSTMAVIPSPSPKKIEKDILKHASRIRTSQLKDYFNHHQGSLRSYPSEHTSSVSNSPTRIHHYNNKRNDIIKPSKSLRLEPLELLLASAPRPLPPRTASLSSRDLIVINHQTNTVAPKKRAKSPKISFVETNHDTHDGTIKTFFLNEHFNSSLLNDESLPLMKTSSLDMIESDKTRQSNSSDSGCYDRSSSSGDTRSITSLSINQPASAMPSARLTSASTRRSNITKKVSFDDQPTAVIVTTATYV